MNNYMVLVKESDCEWFFTCQAEDINHAEEQALDHSDEIIVLDIREVTE